MIKAQPDHPGWAAYYRTQVSSEVFGALDGYLWQLTFKWARFSHANKPTRWVVHRYYTRFAKSRRDRWEFGDRKSGAYMHKFAWTSIVRHQTVKGAASPDDPALAEYWAERRRSTAGTAAARHFCPPTSLRGLLEPDARKRARPGSEGGPAS